jgi:hypothetical protein
MATYPDIAVGQRITADLLTSMLPIVISKTTATTRPSTTTISDDPDLVVPVLANASYFIEMFIRYATTSAAGFKDNWTVPASTSTANRGVIGAGSTQVDTAADNDGGRFGVHGYGTALGFGDRNSVSNQLLIVQTGVVTTAGTAGNVSYAWAQEVSTAVNTAVSAGSFIRATRIG